MKPKKWSKIVEENTFLKGSNCKRLERRLQHRFRKKDSQPHLDKQSHKELGDMKHNKFRSLVNNLSYDPTYKGLISDEKRIFVKYFALKYRLFDVHEEWIDITLQTIENEVWFHTQNQFWVIQYNFFNQWYEQIINRQVPFHESYVLMAILIILCKYNSKSSSEDSIPPFIYLCCDITGFDKKTVAKSIRSLDQRGIIDCERQSKFERIQIKKPGWLKWEVQTTEEQPDIASIKSWEGPLVDLKNYDELQWIVYMFGLPYSDYNPFITFIYPDLIIHQVILNANVLLFSLFSEEQITQLHKVWVQDRYKRSISIKYEKTKRHLKSQLLSIKVEFSSKHYEQIWRCSPILHFISKRKRLVDRGVLFDNIYMQDAIRLINENQLRELIKDRKIDDEHFWHCLRSDDFQEEWEKKYKIEELDPFLNAYDKHSPIIGRILKTEIWGMYHNPIQRYQQATKCHRELVDIQDFLNDNNLQSLNSEFRCLDIKTHRITFRNYAIQKIRKENRLILRAGSGKLFLLVDISSAELLILKWFVAKYQGVKQDVLKELTFSNMASQLNLGRDVIKSLAYPFLYGASIPTIGKESGQPLNIIESFRKFILDFPGIKKFREEAVSYARKNKLSLPTPLGHQFPIFGDPHTQGLSLVIQGTCAELLREWILEINKIGFAPEISNIIHDEIIMEVDEEVKLQRLSQMNECLKKAQETILPGIEINAISCISNSWDKKSGISLKGKHLDHSP